VAATGAPYGESWCGEREVGLHLNTECTWIKQRMGLIMNCAINISLSSLHMFLALFTKWSVLR
jgi:hypothetical protein